MYLNIGQSHKKLIYGSGTSIFTIHRPTATPVTAGKTSGPHNCKQLRRSWKDEDKLNHQILDLEKFHIFQQNQGLILSIFTKPDII